MANFTGLPYETIGEILTHLSSPDLASTARVSHRLHLISQPLLYTTPCLSKNPVAAAGQPSRALGIFLRTLLTPGNEKLASRVRFLQFDTDPIALKLCSANSTDSIAPITTVASKPDMHSLPKSQGSQFMLLLDLLPGLQTLHLTSPKNGSYVGQLHLNLPAGPLPLGLQSIREIICRPALTSRVASITTLLQLMALPRIRYISIPSLAPCTRSITALKSAAGTSHVTRLRVSHGEIPSWWLASILRVPIALTHFSYSAASHGDFNLPSFMTALEPLKKSMRVLHLDFGKVDSTTSDEGQGFPLPYNEGSLREWSVLTTLSCSLAPLLGKGQMDGSPRLADVLPMGLRELEILLDSYWLVAEAVNHVVELLERKESVVPRLERVAVEMEDWMSKRVVEKLVVACEPAGVSLVDESFCW